jgi:hypothetical protein
LRIGILGNNEDACTTPDSFIALGTSRSANAAGNYASSTSDNGARETRVFGYVMVR